MSDAQVQHTIAQLVPEGAHVLDLGCGDGALLQHLITTRRTQASTLSSSISMP